jgi:hypothetical protein
MLKARMGRCPHEVLARPEAGRNSVYASGSRPCRIGRDSVHCSYKRVPFDGTPQRFDIPR